MGWALIILIALTPPLVFIWLIIVMAYADHLTHQHCADPDGEWPQ